MGAGGTVGGPAGAEDVRRAPAPGASRVGRGGNPGRAGAPGRCGSAPGRPEPGRASGTGGMAVPPEAPRDAEGADAEPVRPSPSAGPVGTGRIRKVVSAGLSGWASARRGGTVGRVPGRGGTTPDADGEPCAGTPGVFASGAGGVSGKRAEAGGGGGVLPGNGVLEFRGPDRAPVSEGAWGRPVPVGGFAGALPVRSGAPSAPRPSDADHASPWGGVEPEPASSVVRIGGRPVAPVAWDRSPPGASVSRRMFVSSKTRGDVAAASCRPASPGVRRPDVSGPAGTRAPLSSDSCQSNPPKVARPCAPGLRRLRSPNACQSVSSLIRPPGSTISRRPGSTTSRRPGSSDGSEPGPSSPAAGGWAGLGGVVGRGGIEARRASVLMHPPFPSCPGRSVVRGPSSESPAGKTAVRARIPARKGRHPGAAATGANSPACVRVTLRVVPGRTGTSPPGRGHLPGTSPYPAVILSGSLRS